MPRTVSSIFTTSSILALTHRCHHGRIELHPPCEIRFCLVSVVVTMAVASPPPSDGHRNIRACISTIIQMRRIWSDLLPPSQCRGLPSRAEPTIDASWCSLQVFTVYISVFLVEQFCRNHYANEKMTSPGDKIEYKNYGSMRETGWFFGPRQAAQRVEGEDGVLPDPRGKKPARKCHSLRLSQDRLASKKRRQIKRNCGR